MINLNYTLMLICFAAFVFTLGSYFYFTQIDGVYVNEPIKYHYWNNDNVITHQTTQEYYYPGDMVYARVIATKPSNHICPGTIQWNLVDGIHHIYPSRPSGLEPGRNERIVEIERIPLDTAPGIDYFHGTSTFNLNFVRHTISFPIQTNTFIIKSRN